MKAETAAFLKRAGMAVLLIGTLLVLILVGLNAVVTGLENARADSQDDGNLPGSLRTLPANMPYPEKIQQGKNELGKQSSDGRKASIKHFVAVNYEKDGTAAIALARLDVAESDFKSGLDVEPSNPALWGDLAYVLNKQVGTEQDPDRMSQLLFESGQDYK